MCVCGGGGGGLYSQLVNVAIIIIMLKIGRAWEAKSYTL